MPNLRRILGLPDPDYPKPPLEEGERILGEGRLTFSVTFFGATAGRILLTDRRLVWYENRDVPRPFKRTVGEVRLSDIASVDKGTWIGFLAAGGRRRMRLRMRNGKTKLL